MKHVVLVQRKTLEGEGESIVPSMSFGEAFAVKEPTTTLRTIAVS